MSTGTGTGTDTESDADADIDAAAEAETETEETGQSPGETTVTVRATGHVRTELGKHDFEFTFEGETLREFLEALFAEHPALEDLLIAETETDAAARGWARAPEELPGTWLKNPEGEQTRPYARVTVNGTFNELLDGFNTRLSAGDRIGLLYPFIYCC